MWIGKQQGAVWKRPGLKHLTGNDAKRFCLSGDRLGKVA